MTPLHRFALAAAACLAAWSCAQAAEPPRDAAALERQLAARLDGDRTGACVVAAVIDHGQVLRARHCAGTRADPPPALDAAFEIGSVTKTMTAFLVADLVERGLWTLDDPIAKHLPPGAVVPRQGDRQILVRDLLTHSAGLPALPPGVALSGTGDPYAALTEAQVLDALGRTQLSRPIGSQAEYSNFGMMIVSLAVAHADGGSIDSALRQRLFEPLGMAAYVAQAGAAHPAQGHLPTGQPTPAWTAAPALAGFGMVRASLADMERYARANLGDGPKDLVARLALTHEPLANGYAMNWMLRPVSGHELVMHEGGTGGFSSAVLFDPAAQRAVVLLADTALADLGGLGDLGAALLGLDVPVQPPRLAVPASPALLKAFAGDYQLGALKLRIWQTDGRVMAQASGQPAFELHHDSHGDFYPTTFDALLVPVLEPGPDAPLQRFAWRQGGGIVEGRRIDGTAQAAPTITNPAWRDWAGEYQLASSFSVRIFEQDGRLMLQGTGQPAIEVTVTAPDRIEIKQVGAVVDFERGADGKVVAAVLHQGGQTLRGLRR